MHYLSDCYRDDGKPGCEKFIEELNECGAASARCIIQGINEVEPSTNESNRLWLTKEIADVMANLELVIEHFDLDYDYIEERVNFKQEYLRRWHNL